MRRRRVLTTLLAAAALVLGAATTARAATLGQVVADFRADGAISACKYSVDDLRRIRHEGPAHPQVATRAFRKALRAAITRLKTGGCPATGGAAPPAPTPTTPGATTPAPRAGPAPTPASSGNGVDAATVVLLAAGALVGLIVLAALALALALARWRAWEPEWALGARHAVGEAGYRVTATWADFRDWLRIGH